LKKKKQKTFVPLRPRCGDARPASVAWVQPTASFSPRTRSAASNCRASPHTEAKREKVFLLLFFQKKKTLAFLPLAFA
jgi:hypothetical protein